MPGNVISRKRILHWKRTGRLPYQPHRWPRGNQNDDHLDLYITSGNNSDPQRPGAASISVGPALSDEDMCFLGVETLLAYPNAYLVLRRQLP